jgi:polar amino acid transport system substrate-binding protein
MSSTGCNFKGMTNMMLKPKSKLAFALLMLCLSLPVFSKIRIAYLDVPPYAYQDANHQAKGELVDRFRDMMQALGMEAEFIHLPHRRLIDFIEQKKVDLWAGQDNSRVNNELALVSKAPLFLMDLQVYSKLGTNKVETFDDLYNKDLILISSYSYGGNYDKLAKHSKSVIYALNHEDGFDKMFSGHNKYLLGYKAMSRKVIEKFYITDLQETSLAKYKLYLKMSKTYPDAANIMNKIDALLIDADSKQKN